MTYVCDRNSQHALMSIGNSRVLACGASFTGCTAEPAGLLGAPFPISQHCFHLEMWLALKGTLPFCTLNRDPYIMSTPTVTMATPKPIRTISLSRTCQRKPKQFTSKNELP